MRQYFKLLCVLIGLGLLSAILAWTAPRTLAGGPWYVSTAGNDASSCTSPASPCATIGAVLAKPGFAAGDMIRVATGTYTSTGSEVVLLTKSAVLSGGWDSAFALQAGYSTLHGQDARRGLTINSGLFVTVDRFIIEHGYAQGGGVNNSGTLTLTNSIVRNNSANTWPWSGGGISSNGVLRLIDSTVSGNVSFHLGDGVISYGTTLVDNSAIIDNLGHGIFHSGLLTITNSTFSGNLGVALDFGGDATVAVFNNVTIAKNGAGFNTQGANNVQVRARNSIIAGNSGGDCAGWMTSLGYNLIGSIAGCTITSGPGDQLNVNPGLSVLVGSPAFFPLPANSPAVNAGDPAGCQGPIGLLTTDQRGIARDAQCDIGAFEYVTPGPVTALSGVEMFVHTLPPAAIDPRRMQVRALDAQGNLANNVVVTFTGPASGPGGIFATTGTNSATALTDNSGVATAPEFTSNADLGDYTVTASVGGSVVPVTFLLRNVIWYVSATTGSSANSCLSPTAPCDSFASLMMRSEMTDNHQVRVASGTYLGGSTAVLDIDRSLKISGGWNTAFTQQTGTSVIDGGNARNGISVLAGLTVSLDRFTVRNAAIGLLSSGNLTFNQGSIQDSAQRGIFLASGQARLSNLTIGRNRGGGVTVSSGVSVTLASVTIASNRADTGGGIYSMGGTIILKNSLVAGNTISTTGGVDCSGVITSGGYNLIGQTASCTFAASTGDLLNVDPQLNSWLLGTPGYYALRSTSSAINAGNPIGCNAADGSPLTVDVRDAVRAGRCDIGSYEYLTPTAPATQLILSGTPQYARPGDVFTDQFRVAVLDNNGTPVNSGFAVTFAAPASGASGTFSDTGSITTTALTDMDGVAAAAPFRANSQTGSYAVIAGIGGATSVNFQLFNSAAWYVAPTGNDTNSCLLPTAPCASLNGVLGKVQSGDEIYVATGTYHGVGDAVATINKSVQLSGGWNFDFTEQTGISIVDAENQRRGVAVTVNATVELDGFTIQNGRSGAGGGLYNLGFLMLTNSTMVNNDCNTGANPSYGGAIYNAGVLTVSHSFASHNGTCYHGGAVFNDSAGSVVLDTVDFVTNDAWSGGSIENQGRLIMSNSHISNSLAGYGILYLGGQNGGGLYNLGSAIVTATSFAQNAAYNGGGVFNTGSLILRNSTIISNSVNTYASGRATGAGIHNAGGTLLLENSAVLQNTGYDSTIWTTTPPAPPFGGGIFNSSVMTVNNSLIAHNRVMKSANAADAPLGGGAYNTGALTFNNSTIANNRAQSGGDAGGLFSAQGTLRLHNTIVVSNTAEGTSPDCSGAVTSAGYNLIGTTQDCTFTTGSGDHINTAARFMPQANTTDYRLRYDSPAVNGGDPAGCLDTLGQPLPAIDYRGLPRPIGRCDIGAVEMQALEISSKQASRTNVRPGSWLSYTLTLRNVATNDWPHIGVTDTLPAELNFQEGSLTAPGGAYHYASGIITWTGSLSASSQLTVTFGAQLKPEVSGGVVITNSALIQGADTLLSVSSHIYSRWETALPMLLQNFCADFFDDFSVSHGWPIGEDAYLRAEILNGEYRLLTKQSGFLYGVRSPGCTRGDYVVETDARWAAAHGDGYALVFDIASSFDRYAVFYVSPDYGEFALWHEMNGILQVVPFTHSDAIHTGEATNHLKVTVEGYNVTLEVNGVRLGTWYDGYLTGNSSTGLAVAPRLSSPVADVRFDNFAMRRLLPAASQLPLSNLSAPIAPADRAAPTRSVWPLYRVDFDRGQRP